MRVVDILFNPAIFGTLALFFAALWMLKNPNDKTRPLLVFALVLNLFYGVLFTILMDREGSFFPWKFDHVLFHMDESLGLQTAVIAGRLQGAWHIPLWAVYESMVPMMICWFLVTRYRNARGSVVLAYVAELAAGPLMYTIVPACGPIYLFGAQWLHPPIPPVNIIRLSGMPNSFPSLHVATAFVFVLFAPGKLWRAVSLVFLTATCMATLSTGEHYVIDLIPGITFGTFAASVGLKKYRRALVFLGVTGCWSVGVRLGYPFLIEHPMVTRSCAALTLLFAAWAVGKEWSVHSEPASNSVVAAEALTP
jgi:hypothetical protein